MALSKDLLKWIEKEREKARFKPSRSAFIEQVLREKKEHVEAKLRTAY